MPQDRRQGFNSYHGCGLFGILSRIAIGPIFCKQEINKRFRDNNDAPPNLQIFFSTAKTSIGNPLVELGSLLTGGGIFDAETVWICSGGSKRKRL